MDIFPKFIIETDEEFVELLDGETEKKSEEFIIEAKKELLTQEHLN